MRINDWDIAGANGKQWTVLFNSGYTLKNNSQWDEGAPAPLLRGTTHGLKTLTVTLQVKGRTRQEALYNCSRITGMLTGVVDIQFDNYPNRFKGNVKAIKHTEFNDSKTSHRLEIKMEGYVYGSQISEAHHRQQSFSVNNPGTIDTPVKLLITADSGAVNLTIRGFGKDIVVTNVAKGDTIIIDGETGIATKNGSPSGDITLWRVPVLKAGANAITVSSTWMTVNVIFKPRYM